MLSVMQRGLCVTGGGRALPAAPLLAARAACPSRIRSPAADWPAARRLVCASSSTTTSISSASTSTSNGSGSITPLTFDSPPHFADLPLNRAAALRSDGAELQRILRLPASRAVLIYDSKLLVATAAAGSSNGNSNGSGSSGPLSLQPHSFAAAGTAAPGGGAPGFLPLVASSALLLSHHEQQQQQGGQPEAAAPTFLFLGRDAAGEHVFAALVPPSLLPLLPPPPPPRGAASAAQAGAAQTDAAEQQQGQQPGSAAAAVEGARWVDVRSGGQHMTGPDAAVAAYAVGLAQWHGSAAFCHRSGAPMAATSGGHSRQAVAAPEGSGRRPRPIYPRIDPAVIVAVGCGDWLLLGRKATWEAGRYSCLAGFVEVGETLEQAVAREVLEEAGVPVDLRSARYHSSQPWPFPQSLMIGFIAEAAPTADATGPGAADAPPRRGLNLLAGPGAVAACDVGLLPSEAERYLLPCLPAIQVDTSEIEDARWFHADYLATQLRAASSGSSPPSVLRGAAGAAGAAGDEAPFRIPGPNALANRIISSWLHEQQQRQTLQGGAAESAAAAALAAVPDVQIDEGSFKYVLLRLSTADGLHSKLLVRGDSRAAYHNHVMQHCAAEVRALAPDAGLKLETLGGGRMEHYASQRVVSVYGFSSAFGQAPHDVTAALLRRWLPRHDISVACDGY